MLFFFIDVDSVKIVNTSTTELQLSTTLQQRGKMTFASAQLQVHKQILQQLVCVCVCDEAEKDHSLNLVVFQFGHKLQT